MVIAFTHDSFHPLFYTKQQSPFMETKHMDSCPLAPPRQHAHPMQIKIQDSLTHNTNLYLLDLSTRHHRHQAWLMVPITAAVAQRDPLQMALQDR